MDVTWWGARCRSQITVENANRPRNSARTAHQSACKGSVLPDDLDQVTAPSTEHEQCPVNGSCFIVCSACAAGVVNPRRMSVTPAASHTRVAFAVAVTRFRGSSIAALQGLNPEVRITCLAAICAVQKKPLLKAARIRAKVDDFAKASLLKAYSNEQHLLAAVGNINDRRLQGVSPADRA